MNQIWKFTLRRDEKQFILIPMGAEFLTAQIRNNDIYLWAIVNPKNPTSTRCIKVFGTGQEFSNKNIIYIATVQEPPFVWHIFEEPP